jgi:hypothetical protein
MTEPATLTPLGHQILEHWRRHRPKMVESLERGNQLQRAIFAAQELTGNLLYQLTVVHKMEYHRAWEIATREWAFLPDEEATCCRSTRRPSIRIKPCQRSPHNRRSRHRRGQPKAESPNQSGRNPYPQDYRGREPPGDSRGKGHAREVYRLGRDPECFRTSAAPRMAKCLPRAEGPAERGGVCVSARLNSERALHFSRSCPGDGAIRRAARRTHSRTVDGGLSLLRHDA